MEPGIGQGPLPGGPAAENGGNAPEVAQGEAVTPSPPKGPKPSSSHGPRRTLVGISSAKDPSASSSPQKPQAFSFSLASTADTWPSGRSSPIMSAREPEPPSAMRPCTAESSNTSASPFPSARRNSGGGGGRRRRSSNASTIPPIGQEKGEKARYDVLTLRQWFNYMDTSHSGHVTKQEWFHFLRCNPKLRNLILHGTTTTRGPLKDRFSDESQEILKREAKEMKKLMHILHEIDTDRNGTLEFEEFIQLFRRSGNLVEYGAEHHPRARLAEIVGLMHASPNMVDEALIEEFEQLAKWNMCGERRQSLEDDVLQTVNPESKAAARMVQRRSQCCSVEPPRSFSRAETPSTDTRRQSMSATGSRLMGVNGGSAMNRGAISSRGVTPRRPLDLMV